MKFLGAVWVVTLVFLLMGCEHYTEKLAMYENPNMDNVQAIEPAAGEDMTFSQYLRQDYLQLAIHEQNIQYDFPAAKLFFTKAEDLNQGHMVKPEDILGYEIKDTYKTELSSAYQSIESALNNPHYRITQNRPYLARAQSQFDCWVDEAAEDKVSNCRVGFYQAINSLVMEEQQKKTLDDYLDDMLEIDTL